MGTRDTPQALVRPESSPGDRQGEGPPGEDSSVLIASPDTSVRNRLKEHLQDACVTHEVSQWESLDRTMSSLLPDVVLLDVDLLGASGVPDLSIIRRVCRKTKIILLSARLHDEEAIAALRAGARGYCSRDLDGAALRKAVEKVRQGEIWAERRLIPILVERYVGRQEDRLEGRMRSDRRLTLLTPREREIARLIGAGASNRDIALRLAVGEGTVKAHLTAIFRKLGFTDRLQLGLFLATPDSKSRRRH
jgi:two-component system nitrate/nitrite response regulator NarL